MSKVVASYFYRDAHGEPVARIDRIEPGWHGRSKEFLPYMSDGSGGYNDRPGLNGVKLPLYRLDEVLAAIEAGETVYITEGEGKADELRAALRCAGSSAAVTTIQGGANAPMRPEHVASLVGARQVLVLGDSDDAGRRAMRSRAQRIADAYPPCDVRAMDFYADRIDGSDVADWLAEAHTLDDLLVLAESAPHHESTVKRAASDSGGFVRAYDLASKADEATPWLLENRIPRGGTAVIAGKPKAGKTTLAASIGLAVSRGNDVLGGGTRKGSVLYVALEGAIDEWSKLLRKLGVRRDDEFFFYPGRAPQDAMQWLARSVERYQPVLVIVDPLQRFTRVKESNSYSEISNATDALIDLARKSGAALLFAHHAGKGDKTDAIDAPIGSTAVAGSVDTVFVLRRHGDRRTIQSVQRYGGDLAESVLTMDPETHAVTLAGSKDECDLAETGGAIEQYLKQRAEANPDDPEADEPMIDKNVEGRTKTKREALRLRVAAGRIQRLGSGKKGDPYRYAFSCSLVPGYRWEQENENPKTAESTDKIRTDSCSRDSESSGYLGDENPRDADKHSGPANEDVQAAVSASSEGVVETAAESANDLFRYSASVRFGDGTPFLAEEST